jgi:hypothetical protein
VLIKKKAKALVVASRDSGLEVNDDTTKYMVMSAARMQGGT